MSDRFASKATNRIDPRTDQFTDPAPDSVSERSGRLNRRALLKGIGFGGLAVAGAGTLSKGFGLPSLLGDAGGQAADASPNSCAAASRIGDLRVHGGSLAAAQGTAGPDVLYTATGGSSFTTLSTPAAGKFVPYSIGANGVPGTYGIGGDNGNVMIYDAPTNVWRVAPTGLAFVAGLAGNGNFWIAVAGDGRYRYSSNNGASWNSPSNGAYLNYVSIASILTVYDLEYANGVWIGCGYDTLGVGRTFWRSTNPNPTRGAKNNWFSVSGGDFGETIASGDGNAVTVYSVAYAGSCAPNVWYGAGNFGTVWRSTDNGSSWSKWRDSGSEIHYGIDVNPYTGKVICASGVAGINEVNPGMTQRYSTGGAKSIYEVAWAGANDWVACGDYGQVLVSHNDGVSWTPTTMPPGVTGTLYNLIAKPW